jgi:predicted DsbA family dithiol-disulfide isomerase
MPRELDVISDVVCPWCFIGKRRLQKALALLGNPEVILRHKPFQLNPNAPPEGFDRQAYRASKFGSSAYAKQLEARVAEAGEMEDIHFRFDRITRTPNTLLAHRLIWLAGQDGPQDGMVNALYDAYFLNGEDVGDPNVLERLALGCGLKQARVSQVLSGNLGVSEVESEEGRARMYAVEGVPTFVIDGAPVISGAQPPEVMAAALSRFLPATPAR